MSDNVISPRVLELLRFTQAHNRHKEALARATGAHFNIFKILGISRREVTTHSPMLAELLNPNGTHGQGTAFLRLFLTQFNIQGFDAEGAMVRMEYRLGPVTETSGGRIDILIKDGKGEKILIENKIDAGDQAKQMERYRKDNPKALLFYLTLDGHGPSSISEEELKPIQCVSYGEGILSWLKACRKEAACLPGVRETISQYIHLIEELTKQSTNILMSKELIDKIIENKETYLAYVSLRNEKWNINNAVIAKVNVQLDTIGKELGLETLEKFSAQSKAGENYFYTTKALKAQNLRFGLRCGFAGYKEFVFGFAYIDNKLERPLDSSVIALFKEAFAVQGYSNGFWHAFAIWDHRRDWNDETMSAIISGEFAPELDGLIRKLANVATEACNSLIVQTT